MGCAGNFSTRDSRSTCTTLTRRRLIWTRSLHAGYTAALPYTWVDGNRLYSSFTHLVGYSSNYYTYLFDKVIALDFFHQFDTDNLVEGPAALRYRKEVLEPGGSQPGEALVQNFLHRAQSLQGFETWLTEEFATA